VFESDGRETTSRSPTLTTSAGSSQTERSSTSSDSAFIGTGSNTDHHHPANDRHSADEVTAAARISLPKGLTVSVNS